MVAMTMTAPPSSDGDALEQAIVDLDHRIEAQAIRRDGFNIVVFLVAAIALLFAAIGVFLGMRAIDESNGNAAAAGAASAGSTVTVHLSEFAITPAAIEVAEGGTLQVMNMGNVAHNLTIDGSALKTPDIAAGDSASLGLAGLAPGDYTVICAVPGHEAAGMKATLKVVAGSGGAAAGATATATAATSTHEMTSDEMDAAMKASISAFPQETAGIGAQPLEPTVLADGTKQFELTAKIVDWEVSKGKTVKAWTFNGTVPAPTIHVQPGDKVSFVVHNELPESTAIHFHGLTTPNSQDGVPDITQDPIKPGTTFTYSFVAQSTPTVGMYHSHHDAVKQVPNGMAGAIFVGEMPIPSGINVSQDNVMMLNDAGTIGLTLNGKSFPATAPYVAKLGDWIEVHYMNEGLTVHPMHLHGLAQKVIAKDGYPVPQPYDADTILVGPGERYTVLIKADQLGTWAWHCHILSHAEDDTGMFGMVTALIVKQ
jgi:FtsP/CotA-like multicopper oxidase with cupredoxin domain